MQKNFPVRGWRTWFNDSVLLIAFVLLSFMALESGLSERLRFVVLWFLVGILPGWCLARVFLPRHRDGERALLAVTFSVVIPPLLLYAGSVLFGTSISLVSMAVIAAAIVMLSSFYLWTTKP